MSGSKETEIISVFSDNFICNSEKWEHGNSVGIKNKYINKKKFM